MPAPRDIATVLNAAEAAAAAGDFPSATARLREAVSLQEASLVPQHPDLAETLNNLAIACERTGALDDAEQNYRRAHAIATASLPPSHPFVATSRENLREFCAANNRPFDPPAPPVPQPKAATAAQPKPAPAPPPKPAPRPTPAPSQPRPSLRPVAIGGALVGGVVLLVALACRPWAGSAGDDTAATKEPPAASAPAPSPSPAPVTSSPRPSTPSRADARSTPPATKGTGELPVVVNARLCASLTTGARDWECDRAASTVSPGSLAFYTRIKSPRDGTVRHRWYRGQELVQTRDLRFGANLGPGYRTYSRLAVDRAGDWRVELRASDGTLLHEERFVVR